MSNSDAEILNLILGTFPKNSWSDVEEVQPDEIDLQMLHEAEEDADCKTFLSSDEALREF